jgi:hypothetical protein
MSRDTGPGYSFRTDGPAIEKVKLVNDGEGIKSCH